MLVPEGRFRTEPLRAGGRQTARGASGDPLFVARANLNGGVHPGRVLFAFGVAFIGFGGQEVPVNQREKFDAPDIKTLVDKILECFPWYSEPVRP